MTKNEALLFLATMVESNAVAESFPDQKKYREMLVRVINSLFDEDNTVHAAAEPPKMPPLKTMGDTFDDWWKKQPKNPFKTPPFHPHPYWNTPDYTLTSGKLDDHGTRVVLN